MRQRLVDFQQHTESGTRLLLGPSYMDKPLRLTRSLGEIDTESGVFELFATAVATYDRQTRTAAVMLNSFLLLRRAKCPTARLLADSNVGPRTVAEESTEEKYMEVVASIFANWVRQLEQAKPRRSVESGGITRAVSRTISAVSTPSNSSNGAGFTGSANWVLADLARGLS